MMSCSFRRRRRERIGIMEAYLTAQISLSLICTAFDFSKVKNTLVGIINTMSLSG
jgi:hypothetical protein